MNFIQFSFSNAYVYSPNTWLHKMRTKYKILIIFCFLSFVPYFNLAHLTIIILACLIIIPTLKFYENYYYSCYSVLITTTLCLLPYNFNDKHYDMYRKIQINFPCRIHDFLMKYAFLRRIICFHNKTLLQLKTPYFIIKLGTISILYSIILKTLLLTTMYEDIILSICSYIKINNFSMKRIIFISSFASQFLEQMIKRIQIIYTSIKLRNVKSIVFTNKLSVSYYITAKFLNYLKYDVHRLSSVLYSREFNNKYIEMNNISTYI